MVEMSSASPRSQSAEREEEKNEEAKRKEDEEEDDGEEETEDENRIVASCRVCLEPIRKSDVMIENNSACLLGCKCSQVGIHLNRECGIKYLKNLQRPNQTLTLCEVCQSPMSEFATKIQPVLNATTTSRRSSPFALHDSDGFLHTFSRPRRRPAELCEFFCFLVPCLPCVALAYTNCFHSTCVSLMRFRAYIFLGVILALLIIFLSDVYLTMEDKYESRVREQRKDIDNNGPSRYPSNDDDFNNNNNFNGGMNYNPNAYDYYSRGRG